MDISGLPRNSTDLAYANILEGTRQYFQGLPGPNATVAPSRLLSSSYTYQALGNGRSQESSTLGSPPLHPGSQWRPPSDKLHESSSMGPFMAALNQLQTRSVPASSSSRIPSSAVPHQQAVYSHHQSYSAVEKSHSVGRASIAYTHANGYLSNRGVTVTSSSITSDPSRSLYQYPTSQDNYYERKGMLLTGAEAIARGTPSKIFQYNDLNALNYNNINSSFSDSLLSSKEESSLSEPSHVSTTYRATSTNLTATVEPTSTNVEPKSDKKTKSDSPIDLSVKTVRQTADSTALDEYPDSSTSTPKLPEIPSLMLPDTKALPTYFETKKPSAPPASARLPSPMELNSFSPPTTAIPSASPRIPSMPKESLMRVADSHLQQLAHRPQSSMKYPQSSYSMSLQQSYGQARHAPQKQQYHTPHSPRHQPQYQQVTQISRHSLQYQQSQEHAHSRQTQEVAYQHSSFPHATAQAQSSSQSQQATPSSVSSRQQNSHTSLSYQQTSQIQQSQMYQKMLKQQQQSSAIQHSSSSLIGNSHHKSSIVYPSQQMSHRSQQHQVIQQAQHQHPQDQHGQLGHIHGHSQQHRHLQQPTSVSHQTSLHQQKQVQQPLPSMHQRQPSPMHPQSSLNQRQPSPMHPQSSLNQRQPSQSAMPQHPSLIHSQQPSPIVHSQQPSPIVHSQQPSPILQSSPVLHSQQHTAVPHSHQHTPAQPSPILHPQQPSPVLHPQQPSPVLHPQQPSPILHPQQPSPILQSQQSSPIIHSQQPSALPSQQPSPMHSQQPSPMRPQQPSPIHSQQPSPMHSQQASPMHSQQPSPMQPQQPSPMQPQQSSSMASQQASPMHSQPSPVHPQQPSPLHSQEASTHTQKSQSSAALQPITLTSQQQQPPTSTIIESAAPTHQSPLPPATQQTSSSNQETEALVAKPQQQPVVKETPDHNEQSSAEEHVSELNQQSTSVVQKQETTMVPEQSQASVHQPPSTQQQSESTSAENQQLPVEVHPPESPVTVSHKQLPATTSILQQLPSTILQVSTTSQQPPVVTHQKSPATVSQKQPAHSVQKSPSMVNPQSSPSPVLRQQSPIIQQQWPSTVLDQQTSVLRQQPSPVVQQQQSSSVLRQQSPTLHQQSSTLHQQQQSPSIHSQHSTRNQQPPISSHGQQNLQVHQQQLPSMHPQQSLVHNQQPSTLQQSSSMHQQQSSPLRQQQPSPMHQQQPSPMHQQQPSPMHQQQSSPMHQQQSSPMHQQQSSPMHQQQSPMHHQQSSPMHHQHQSSPMHQQQSPALHHQQPTPVHHQQQQSSIHHQQSTSMHQQQPPIHHQQRSGSLHPQQPNSVHHQQPTSVHHQQPTSVHHQQPTSVHHQQSTHAHHQSPQMHHQQSTPAHHQMHQQSSTHHQQHASAHPQSDSLLQQQSSSVHHKQSASMHHQQPTAMHLQPSSLHHQQLPSHHQQNSSVQQQQQPSALHQQHHASIHQQTSVHSQHPQLQQQHNSALHQQQQTSGAHQKPHSSSHHLQQQQSAHHMRNLSQQHSQYLYQQQAYSQQHQSRAEPSQKTHPHAHYQYLQQQQQQQHQNQMGRQQSHIEQQQQSQIERRQNHLERQQSHIEQQQSHIERQSSRVQYQDQYKQSRVETQGPSYPQYKQETPRIQHLSVQQQPTYSQHSRTHAERRIAYPQDNPTAQHKLYNQGLPSKQPSTGLEQAVSSGYQMGLKRGNELQVMGPPSKVPKMEIPSMMSRSASLKDLGATGLGLTQKPESCLEQQILTFNYNGGQVDRNRYGMSSPSANIDASVRSLLRNTLEQKQEQKMKYRPSEAYSSSKQQLREATPPSNQTGFNRHEAFHKTNLPASHYPPTPPLSSSSPSIGQQRTESSSPAGTPVNHPLHVHVHPANKEVPRMTPPAELDGLAASLAARIRTKAELKQMSPLPPSLPEKAAVVPSRTLTPGSTSTTIPGRDSTEALVKKDLEGATSVFEFKDTEEEDTNQISLDSLRKSKLGQSPARSEESSNTSENWDKFTAKLSDFVNDLQVNTNIKIKKVPTSKRERVLPVDDYFDITSDEEVTFEPVPEVKRIYPEVPLPTLFDLENKKSIKKEKGLTKKRKSRKGESNGAARGKRRDSITKYTGQCTSDSDEGSDATYVPSHTSHATRRRSARTYRSDSESVSDFEDELAEMRRRPKKLIKSRPKAHVTPKKESVQEGNEMVVDKETDSKTEIPEIAKDSTKDVPTPVDAEVPADKKIEPQVEKEKCSTPKKDLVEGDNEIASKVKENETTVSEKEMADLVEGKEQKKLKRSKKKKLKHRDGKKADKKLARRQAEEQGQELDVPNDQRKVQPVKLRLVRKLRTHERASVGERLRQRRRIEKKTKGGRMLRIREVERSEESGDEREEGGKTKSEKSDLKLKIKAERKVEDGKSKLEDGKEKKEKIEENKENPDGVVEDDYKDGIDSKSRRFALREKRALEGSGSSTEKQKKAGLKKIGKSSEDADKEKTKSITSKPKKGHNNFFSPGWENDLVNFKRSIRMPPNLIRVTKPAAHVKGQKRKGAVMAAKVAKEKMQKAALGELEVAGSPIPDDNDVYSLVEKFKKSKADVGDSSIKTRDNSPAHSLTGSEVDGSETKGEDAGFVTSLSKESVINKLENSFLKQNYKHNHKHRTRSKEVEKVRTNSPLIPTPGLTDDPKAIAATGFRKQTLEAYAELSPNKNGFKDFAPEILETKTRTQTKALKHEVTIKQVFGQDLPDKPSPGKSKKTKSSDELSSPETQSTPIPNHEQVLVPPSAVASDILDGKPVNIAADSSDDTVALVSCDSGEVLSTLSPALDADCTAEMPMPEIVPTRRPLKLRYIKRKLRFRSGFDYMRKKNKKKLAETEEEQKERKRLWHEARQRLGSGPGGGLEADRDPAKEVRNWALNKSLGETALHRAAKLGFYYVATYCIEMGFGSVSSRNNAGISPLHVACARGNLEVARLLLEHGADPNSNSPGGVRPLHEAVDYMHTEMCRLLLSYGADPCLITYSGLSPVSLCKEAQTHATIQGHLADIQGLSSTSWEFKGSASCLDVRPTGFNVLGTIPPPDCDEKSDEENSEGMNTSSTMDAASDCGLAASDSDLCRFQMSDSPIINTYQVKGHEDMWALKVDLPPSILGLSDLHTMQLSSDKFLETARCRQVFLGRTFSDSSQVVMVKLVGSAAQLSPLEDVSFRDG